MCLFSVTSLWRTLLNAFAAMHPTHILEHPRVNRAHRLKTAALALQPAPESRFRIATHDESYLRSDLRWRRYVSDLSKVTPWYLGSEQKDRVLLLRLTFSSRLASLLLSGSVPICASTGGSVCLIKIVNKKWAKRWGLSSLWRSMDILFFHERAHRPLCGQQRANACFNIINLQLTCQFSVL